MSYGGGQRQGDTGFCFVHRRKRLRADLMPAGDAPGRYCCLPHKLCRSAETVVCQRHNRRRHPQQMREVGPGRWECMPDHECRPGPPGRGGPRLGGRPRESGEGREGPAWGPGAPVAVAHPRPGVRRDRSGASLAGRQVLCAAHGKLLPMSQCALTQDCCYICRDSSACLAIPVPAPADLTRSLRSMPRARPEVLCRRHNTLRVVEFMERCDDRSGYQCAAGHPCRCATLQTGAGERGGENGTADGGIDASRHESGPAQDMDINPEAFFV
eukprot:gene13348-9180_t